ncbi:sugar ABC transporter permease [Actinoplanes sp. NPDC051861]|uniref:carbohydrate ABC transporter permease n=1 Tax=Actinoplanes sp. NPDC051861 TaxID=3155170 RepID=UPI00341658B7
MSKIRNTTRDKLLSWALLAPSILIIAVFVYGFIAFTGFASVTRWATLVPDFTFVGTTNYSRVLGDSRFRIDIVNIVEFSVVFILFCLALGFFLAVLVDQHVVGENMFRAIYLLPLAVSPIVTGVVWRWLMSPGNEATGPQGLNALFDSAGLGFLKNGWFTDENFGIKAVAIAAGWQMAGYAMALYLANLRNIPDELREAARLDGASEFAVYQRVIVPLMRPVTVSIVVVLGQVALNVFGLVLALSGRGVGFSSDVPAILLFDTAYRSGLVGRGAAIATILFLLVAVLVVPYLARMLRQETAR